MNLAIDTGSNPTEDRKGVGFLLARRLPLHRKDVTQEVD
jgi:hypothetical protein